MLSPWGCDAASSVCSQTRVSSGSPFQGISAVPTVRILHSVMQRLFSTFPNSWPGLGLLILRLALTGALVVLAGLFGRSTSIVLGGFLVAGLWTPLAALAGAGLCLWSAFTVRDALSFISAGLAVSVAALGPGAWSLDAMIYGRRKIDIKRRDDRD
jgi:putative oxidoreductase